MEIKGKGTSSTGKKDYNSLPEPPLQLFVPHPSTSQAPFWRPACLGKLFPFSTPDCHVKPKGVWALHELYLIFFLKKETKIHFI